jgi:hypothetical protein
MRATLTRDNAMWLNTKTILVALVIINAIAIGLSEIQRRTLVEDSIRAQQVFQAEANRVAEQQAVELKKMGKALLVLTDRVNHTEVLTLTVPDASNKIQDIFERVMDIQRKQYQ